MDEPGKNVARTSGLNRSISGQAWGRTVTVPAYRLARRGGTPAKVPAPNTSRRCSACGSTPPGSRETQALFMCKNPDCRWTGNAGHTAARNILHLDRTGRALLPAAGRAVARRAPRVKPATARQAGISCFSWESAPQAGLDAESEDQVLARPVVDTEGPRLSAAAVDGHHRQALQTLPHGGPA